MSLVLTPVSETALTFGADEGSSEGWGAGAWGGEDWGSEGFDPSAVSEVALTVTPLAPTTL